MEWINMESKITLVGMKLQESSKFKGLKGYRKTWVNNSLKKLEAHPGFSTCLSDHWDDILKVATGDYKGLAEAVIKGADTKDMVTNEIRLKQSRADTDQIRVLYKAWSEDELKRDTCKVIQAPPEAKRDHEQITNIGDTHMYTAICLLEPKKVSPGKYTFIFGAQDDGWYYDSAVVNQVDIILEA